MRSFTFIIFKVIFIFSITVFSEVISKREFTVNGVVYVEETSKNSNGAVFVTRYKKEDSQKYVSPPPAPTPAPTPTKASAQQVSQQAKPPPVNSASAEETTKKIDFSKFNDSKKTKDKIELDGFGSISLGPGAMKHLEQVAKDEQEMRAKIANCEPWSAQVVTPFIPIPMYRKVHGLVDGKCKFTQAMPENAMQICFFTQAQLSVLKSSNKPDLLNIFMEDEATCKVQVGE